MMKCLESMFGYVLGILLAASLNAAEPAGTPDTKTVGPKSYQIRNQKFGSLLRPEEANSANGTPIVLYPAQPWKCMTWKLHPSGENQFQLQNHFTSKTFSAGSGDNTSTAFVSQVPFGTSASERPTWRFSKLSDGTYRIIDVKSGQALTAAKEGDSSRIRVTVQAWQGTGEQKWELIEIDPKQLTM